jgi:hypothetical protein
VKGDYVINALNSSATVGTSSVVVSEQKVTNNAERVRLILTNTSTGGQIISISAGQDPVAGAGLQLSPGGSMGWEKQSSTPIQQLRVFAISSGAGGTLAVYEEVMQ